MQAKTIKLKGLKYAPYNPRTIQPGEFLKLKKSLERYGQVQVLVVNTQNQHVVGGNQTLRAMRELKWTEAEAIHVDLDDDEEKMLNIALNRIDGTWDFGQVGNILADLKARDIKVEFTGMDTIEINNLSNLGVDGIAPIVYEPDGNPDAVPGAEKHDPLEPNMEKKDGQGEDEWDGMPEFEQEDQTGVQSIVVHFKTHEDVQDFANRIGQALTDKTKYIWHPKMERLSYNEKVYVTPGEETNDGE